MIIHWIEGDNNKIHEMVSDVLPQIGHMLYLHRHSDKAPMYRRDRYRVIGVNWSVCVDHMGSFPDKTPITDAHVEVHLEKVIL